jgi:nitrilase
MKIAALQMVSTPDVDRNVATAARLIAEAASEGAQLLALPEYFCLMGRSDRDKLVIAEVPGDGPLQRFLAEQARQHGVWLIGGTVPLRCTEPERVRNSCCVYAPDGSLAARYDKLHLFAFDNGGERYDEGRVLQAGDEPVAAQLGDWRVGLSICYDLRFPELYRSLMGPPALSTAPPPEGAPAGLEAARRPSGPCDILSVPAAFTYTTGRDHWDLLLRARAVENQCYVIAAAQGGTHENGRRTWGRSQVIDPWGQVLALCEEGEGIALAEIDAARIAQVRAQLPALQHRRC